VCERERERERETESFECENFVFLGFGVFLETEDTCKKRRPFFFPTLSPAQEVARVRERGREKEGVVVYRTGG